MQGKPMTPLNASMHGVATREQQATMAADVVWLTAENGRLRARLATYEAALRELVVACTTGDTYADGRPAGVRTPEREVLECARKALEDNT